MPILHEICVQFILGFSDSSKPIKSVSSIYEWAWLAGIRKSEQTSCKVAPVTKLKLPTYFDDVTTIENNRQVHVNIDATLVAILRIVVVFL